MLRANFEVPSPFFLKAKIEKTLFKTLEGNWKDSISSNVTVHITQDYYYSNKLRTLHSWECFHFDEKVKWLLTAHVHDIKMVGREKRLAPIWARLQKKINLEDPSPPVHQGCIGDALKAQAQLTRRRTRTEEMFQIITESNVEGTPTR